MFAYCSVAQARREIVVRDGDTVGDADLLERIYDLSQRFREEAEHDFLPLFESRDFYVPESASLSFDEPLMSLTSIADANDSVIASTDYEIVDADGNPTTKTPIWYIDFDVAFASDDPVTINGVWGWRRDYAQAYRSSNDTVITTALTTAATTVKVADADGVDAYGVAPRFSPGQYIKIDSELMLVVAVVAASTNELTVLRAQRGTTAAEHTTTTAISIFMPDPTAARALARWVGYSFKRKGNFERASFDGVNVTSYPKDMPDDVLGVLPIFRRVSNGAV